MTKTKNDLMISNFVWKHRLLVVVAQENSELFKKVAAYRQIYACDITDRNIHIIEAVHGTHQWMALPEPIRKRSGLHLVGYDGGVKDYSSDGALLGRLDLVIDQMPMRQRELAGRNQQSPC